MPKLYPKTVEGFSKKKPKKPLSFCWYSPETNSQRVELVLMRVLKIKLGPTSFASSSSTDDKNLVRTRSSSVLAVNNQSYLAGRTREKVILGSLGLGFKLGLCAPSFLPLNSTTTSVKCPFTMRTSVIHYPVRIR